MPDPLRLDRYSNGLLLSLYEEEIDRSGCFPYQEQNRSEWEESGWGSVYAMRDELLRRMGTDA